MLQCNEVKLGKTGLELWTQPLPPGHSTDFYRDLALLHCSQAGRLGQPLSKLVKSGDYKALCNFVFEYSDATAWELYHARQVCALFSKLEYLEIGIDKRGTALKTYFEAEDRCHETNEVFRALSEGRFNFRTPVDRVLSDATRKIARVLGPCPPIRRLGLRFGPGSTVLTKKREAHPSIKLDAGLCCSEDLLGKLPELLLEIPSWAAYEHCYPFVDGGLLVIDGDCSILREEYYSLIHLGQPSKAEVHFRATFPILLEDEFVDFVPKNAKTHRVTTKPTPLSGMLQLGIGDYMARRLLRFGIDTFDQSINQRLAKEGSLTGALATLDLSSASDLLSYGLVLHLLPPDWFELLASCRSSYAIVDGKRIFQEKFSSMGNGFTFPLETLIFWALSSASCDEGDVVSVYGDDIIIPSRHVPLLVEVLHATGSKLNLNKSYSSGEFRESCGTDWYRGFNIRPYYPRKEVSGEVLFTLHNFYVQSGQMELADIVLGLIPEHLRLFGPARLGDGVLHRSWLPGKKKGHIDKGYCGSVTLMYKKSSGKMKVNDLHPAWPSYCAYRRSADSLLPADVKPIDPFRNLGVNWSHAKFLRTTALPSRSVTPCDDGYLLTVPLPRNSTAYETVLNYSF